MKETISNIRNINTELLNIRKLKLPHCGISEQPQRALLYKLYIKFRLKFIANHRKIINYWINIEYNDGIVQNTIV